MTDALMPANELLISVRDMFIRARKDANAFARQCGKLPQPSETLARILLANTNEIARTHRRAATRRRRLHAGASSRREIIESYLRRVSGSGEGFFATIHEDLWNNDYIRYIERQEDLVEAHKQTHIEAWKKLLRSLQRPVYELYMKRYFSLILTHVNATTSHNCKPPKGLELLYYLYAGYMAAHITMFPQLEQALKTARPDLDPRTALLSELLTESVIAIHETPDALESLSELPGKAAARIQDRYYVSRMELLAASPETARLDDPAQTAIARIEVREHMRKMTRRERRIARLLAASYTRAEIATELGATEEAIKKQAYRMRTNARAMSASRN